MTVEELLQDREQQGLEQGIQQGLERMGRLCILMKNDDRLEEYVVASSSPELLEKLFKEYGL